MNYPVHEIEMLAGIESMRWHRDILLGCSFTWVMDHKGLIHLLKQRNLSGHQAQWLEWISEFNFTIKYVPGVKNVLADALSCIYAHNRPGTVRAPSEYMQFDEEGDFSAVLQSFAISAPVSMDPESIVGLEQLGSPPKPATMSGGRMLHPQLPKPVPVTAPQRKGKGHCTQGGDLPAASSSQAEGDLVLEGASASKAAPQPGETSHEKTHPISQPATPETAGEATLRPVQTHPFLSPPETRCPETAKEFAKCISTLFSTALMLNNGRVHSLRNSPQDCPSSLKQANTSLWRHQQHKRVSFLNS